MSRWQGIWRGFRRDEQIVLFICAIVLAFCAGLSYSRSGTATPLPPIFQDAPRSAGKGSTASAATIVVHVVGQVRKPGVLTLPDRARTVDAVRGAGGATSDGDLSNLNLAAPLQDGQQIVVPSRHKAVAATIIQPPARAVKPSDSLRSKKAFSGIVNINRASATELEALPGVGPAIAARIIEYRTQNGPFRSLSDLDAVKGIGAKKLEKLKDHVAF